MQILSYINHPYKKGKGYDQTQNKKQGSRMSEGNKELWGGGESIFLKEYIEFLVLDYPKMSPDFYIH